MNKIKLRRIADYMTSLKLQVIQLEKMIRELRLEECKKEEKAQWKK